jgi:hypothetical protein
MSDHDVLVADLRALGATASVPEPSAALTDAVLARVGRAPVRRWWLVRRRRALVAAVAAVLVGLAAAPPVRAAVSDWFGFGAIKVERGGSGGSPGSTSAPPPAPVSGSTVAEARRLVAFPVLVPAELGRPDGVSVSADRLVVSMSWDGPDGPVRLDQLGGRLDYSLVKTARDVEFVSVRGEEAVWFPTPHDLVWLAPDGTRRTSTSRLAGPTLVWESGGSTLRLEGDLTLLRAQTIAVSAR